MFGNAFGWPHLLIILVILLLLFGAPKLPGLAKSIAQSMKIFKTEIGNGGNGATNADGTPAGPTAAGTTAPEQSAPTSTSSSTDYPPKS